ncbi:Ser/Thr protein phosphatase [Tritrichomonas foetus]|uniref:Serine/threonine-protein phosphatase n=1 Tax=Tritrichomonas foetus TaxID=1144522 RepID=A0A1J4JM16_9EUKA|nr:Ser/Thr protein phosphatase [Tritrichomonas foetus]|eukprot:OHS98573.1 Ser/Thr protein phosphatase [Tritrichomonas foetus]
MSQHEFHVDKIFEKLTKSPPELLEQNEVVKIIELSTQLFMKEENLLNLASPIIIVGDIHGQLYDLLEIFRVEPPPPESKYLFLGDYVDRGYYSLETLMYLLCLKIKNPDSVFLLRGNHECAAITRTYGFYQECIVKYKDHSVYQRCCELFNFLPLAALINNRIFATHGGLSPNLHLIDQLAVVDRFQEPMLEGPLPDLLWADPSERNGFTVSKRGVGYNFGGDVSKKFAYINNLVHITRAHQVAMKGYQIWFDGLVSTVWSAPNYMYRTGNLASVMRVSNSQRGFSMSFNIFDAVPQTERTVPETNEVLSPYFI